MRSIRIRHRGGVRLYATMILCLTFCGVSAGQEVDSDYGAKSFEFVSTRPARASNAGSQRNSAPRKPKTPPRKSVVPEVTFGYTPLLWTNGLLERADTRKSFADGDWLRFMIECNRDGYLYVFAEDLKTGQVVMLYPHVRIDGGRNWIKAHAPFEVPSRRNAREDSRWLVLSGGPTTDRFYLFWSPAPIPGVPTGGKLAESVKDQSLDYWMPCSKEWNGVIASSTRLNPIWGTVSGALSRDEDDAVSGAKSLEFSETIPAPAVLASARVPKTGASLHTVLDVVNRGATR